MPTKKKSTKKTTSKKTKPSPKNSKKSPKASPRSSTKVRLRSNEVICVFGRKGSGKSYWIKQHLAKIPAGRSLWVWDPVSEYAGPSAEVPLHSGSLFYSMRSMLEAAKAGKLGKRVVLQAPRSEFDLFCTFAYRTGQVTVVVDEINLFCSPSKCPAPLLELLRIGRHAEVDLIFAARRPAEVSRDLTAQSDKTVAFKTIEPADLEFFSKVCGKAFAERLPNLAQYVPELWEG